MQGFPHHYSVLATGANEGNVTIASPGLTQLETAAPPEFDGPGGYWSPETMLVGAVANCYILTFRAIANASKLPWMQIECNVLGVLDRVERVTRFTEMQLNVTLKLPADVDRERAQRLLEKSEQACLITNSLSATKVLKTTIL